MIIQNAKGVFTNVVNNAKAEYQDGYVYFTRKAELIPEKFPYCCMTQIENSGDGKTSIGNKPTLWKQGYEWQLASNKISGALDELENIEKIITESMQNMGYEQTFSREILNLADASITRKVIRFNGRVGINSNKENSLYIYRR